MSNDFVTDTHVETCVETSFPKASPNQINLISGSITKGAKTLWPQKTYWKQGVKHPKVEGASCYEKDDIPGISFWTSKVVTLTDLRGLHKFLEKHTSQQPPRYAVMRAFWLPDGEITKRFPDTVASLVCKKGNTTQRVRTQDVTYEVPLHWIAFDIDGIYIDDLGDFDVANPQPWLDAAIESELGPEFVGVDYIANLSGSAGAAVLDKNREPHYGGVRAHIWFWLDHPFDRDLWNAWFNKRAATLGRKPKIDPSFFNLTALHYIQPPVFRTRKARYPDPDPVQAAGGVRLQYVECGAASVALDPEPLRAYVKPKAATSYKSQSGAVGDLGGYDPRKHHDPVRAAFCRAFKVVDTLDFINEVGVERFSPVDDNTIDWCNRSTRRGVYLLDGGLRVSSYHANNWPRQEGGDKAQIMDAWEFVAWFRFREGSGWREKHPEMQKFARLLPEVEQELEKIEREERAELESQFGEADANAAEALGGGDAKRGEFADTILLGDVNAHFENAQAILGELAHREVVFRNSGVIVEPTLADGGKGIAPIKHGSRFGHLLQTHGIRVKAMDKQKSFTVQGKGLDSILAKIVTAFDHPALQPLGRVARRPFFQIEGGGALLGEGYHRDKEVLVRIVEPWGRLIDEVPAAPTLDDVKSALGVLSGLLKEFEFESLEDRAAALAFLVTAVVRPAFTKCPAFVALASEPQSGKSTLTGLSHILAGEKPWTIKFGKDAEANSKILISALISGRSVIEFDNIGNGWDVNDPSLNRYITSEEYGDRVLQKSLILTFPTDRMIVLNGNGLTLSHDMASRSVIMNLDPMRSRADGKEFEIELHAWAAEKQFDLVKAALTVARYGAQRQMGRGESTTRFDKWEQVVAHPIRLAGEGDPTATLRANRVQDEAGRTKDSELAALTALAAFSAEREKPRDRATPFDRHDTFTVDEVFADIAEREFSDVWKAFEGAGLKHQSKNVVGRSLTKLVHATEKAPLTKKGGGGIRLEKVEHPKTRTVMYRVVETNPTVEGTDNVTPIAARRKG